MSYIKKPIYYNKSRDLRISGGYMLQSIFIVPIFFIIYTGFSMANVTRPHQDNKSFACSHVAESTNKEVSRDINALYYLQLLTKIEEDTPKPPSNSGSTQ